MSQTTSITRVPFHGDDITCIETPEGVFVAITAICARLGLSASTQRGKLNRDQERWRAVHMTLPSARGEQETLCLPLTKLAAWLFSVNASKVKPELRLAVERYQAEAAEVLDRHFRLKEAEKEAEIALLREQLACSHAFLLLSNPKWATIKLLMERHTSHPTIGRRTNLTMGGVNEELGFMRDCGIVPMFRTRAATVPALHERIRDLEASLWVAERRIAETKAQRDLFAGAPDA